MCFKLSNMIEDEKRCSTVPFLLAILPFYGDLTNCVDEVLHSLEIACLCWSSKERDTAVFPWQVAEYEIFLLSLDGVG